MVGTIIGVIGGLGAVIIGPGLVLYFMKKWHDTEELRWDEQFSAMNEAWLKQFEAANALWVGRFDALTSEVSKIASAQNTSRDAAFTAQLKLVESYVTRGEMKIFTEMVMDHEADMRVIKARHDDESTRRGS